MQNQDKKSRNSFVDTGLLISICVFIIMLIKSGLFGFSWASIFWILAVIVYWFLVYMSKKHDNRKFQNIATICFLTISVFVFASIMFFDKNARPKMHAFEGAAIDTVAEEEEFIVDETPDISVVETPDTTETIDTIMADSVGGVLKIEIENEGNGDQIEETEIDKDISSNETVEEIF
ncbi:MAG: hypothetical protein K6E54_10260 [Bacteroidaceae bacterium]|nr:hypothetical protein [Bacteroidaceae bacterium]